MSLVNDPTQMKVGQNTDAWERTQKKSRDSIFEDGSTSIGVMPTIFKDSPKTLLMQKAISNRQAELGPNGELIVFTGTHTGRAADDKYVVHNEKSAKKIWWENNIKPMGEESFQNLYDDVVAYLYSRNEIFTTSRSIGKSGHFALNIDFISEVPSAALFTQYMFKEVQAGADDTYKVLHAPYFEVDPFKYGTRSDAVITTCFDRKCVIIAGTQYAGEIKKSMFSVMNFLAPEEGILPMHAGANMNPKEESFVFFGLSGTGKTTLSHDDDTTLIGDDEHGLSHRGIFNFENGCYAKTYNLSRDYEPEIHAACTQFSSFLENVKLHPETREVDFFDASITENGRASYPLRFIQRHVPTGEGKIPKDVFFLSADAFGVLPPLSQLTLPQAVDYFVLGYTAKLAGTEIGVKEPKATFSPCFGAPFMLRHPMEYANLFAEYIKKHDMRVWLVNTGWTGGSAEKGKGKRFPLPVTREIVRAVQNQELHGVEFTEEPFFGLRIPRRLRHLDEKILNPIKAWASEQEYQNVAIALKKSFDLQLAKFRH